MDRTRRALLAVGLMLGASAVFACAESTFHPDQGMRYHGFTTRRPADILFYRPEFTNDPTQPIPAGLRRAGHRLTVVAEQPEAIDALSSHHFDLIIARPRDMDALAAHLNSSRQAPALLPVIDDTDTSDQARFPQYVRESDGVDKYLKSIERMRERRS
jgi:hypothetical protein